MNDMQCLAEGVLIINLDDRSDRWEDFQQEQSHYFACMRMERLSAVKGTALPGFGEPPLFRGRKRDDTWAGRAGCALSHREAINFAASAGWDSVLILEDDIQVNENMIKVCNELVSELSREPWDICYLGFTDPVGPFRKLADLNTNYALFELFGCSTTHAYLVRNTAYQGLLNMLPNHGNIWHWLTRHRAIDRWYARNLSRKFRVLAISPALIQQKQGISDITGRNQEGKHVTAIHCKSSRIRSYSSLMTLRRIKFILLDMYDALRGFIKRRKGF